MKKLRPLALLLLALACGSDEQNYCENIGDCAQGGSNDWVQSCEGNLNIAQSEANGVGCKTQFDALYSCNAASYVCNGNVAAFPGCDSARATLDSCIEAAQQRSDGGATYCAALVSQQTSAGCGSPDAAVNACSATRDCEAQCFLANVTNVCAPDVVGLEAYTKCAATCP